MSYFIDPWLYNCADNPADSPEQQLEQRTIIAATQRALDYAHAARRDADRRRRATRTPTSGTDDVDDTSPDFPPGTEHARTVDNTCLDLPTEGNNVLVDQRGRPDEAQGRLLELRRRADHRRGAGRLLPRRPVEPRDDSRRATGGRHPNLILAAYPENVAREAGDLNPDGTPNTPFVVRDCRKDTCAYYQYIQGTSMASPHAVGRGRADRQRARQEASRRHDARSRPRRSGSSSRRPPTRRARSRGSTATRTRDAGRASTRLCVGTPEFNGFYGHGIIDALAAVENDKH